MTKQKQIIIESDDEEETYEETPYELWYKGIEKVYQVRVYHCDDPIAVIVREEKDYLTGACDFVEGEGGKWEFATRDEAMVVFRRYETQEMEKGDLLVITETPKMTEDECEEAGFEYQIKDVVVLAKKF